MVRDKPRSPTRGARGCRKALAPVRFDGDESPCYLVTMFKTIWRHLKSWPELYVCLPLVLLTLPGSSLFIYALTGRAPQESMQWILDLSGRVNVAALIILFASFSRQATGVWLTKEEMLANPYMATCSLLTKIFYFVFFGWLFTH